MSEEDPATTDPSSRSRRHRPGCGRTPARSQGRGVCHRDRPGRPRPAARACWQTPSGQITAHLGFRMVRTVGDPAEHLDNRDVPDDDRRVGLFGGDPVHFDTVGDDDVGHPRRRFEPDHPTIDDDDVALRRSPDNTARGNAGIAKASVSNPTSARAGPAPRPVASAMPVPRHRPKRSQRQQPTSRPGSV